MRLLARWAARLLVAFVAISAAVVLVYRFVDPPLTPVMVAHALTRVGTATPVGIDQQWVDLREISPALVRAVITAEDARFFDHRGVDLEALARARAYNARHPRARRRGASTITMQCARNVFLWQGRTYVRKALEAYFAGLMELAWGKRRILEVYLNVVEWGPGVYGAEAAARRHFGVAASDLDPARAALLAAVLPNPRRWSPAAPTPYVCARAATIARRAAAVRLDGLR